MNTALLRNLGVTAFGIVAAVAGLYLVMTKETRENTPSHAHTELGAQGIPPGAPAGLQGLREAQAGSNASVASSSRALMPRGFEGLSLGLEVEGLRRLRPTVRKVPPVETGGNQEVWEEDAGNGERVLYLFHDGPPPRRLEQIQWAASLRGPEELTARLADLGARLGPPTGIWNCPQSETAPAMRRFTWRREGSSVMEAVLLYQNQFAVTQIVASTEELGRVLRRYQCQAIRDASEIDRLPVASRVPGTAVPIVQLRPDSPRPREAPSGLDRRDAAGLP